MTGSSPLNPDLPPTRIAVCGSAGKMGCEIHRAAANHSLFTVSGALECAGSANLGLDAGEIAGIGSLGISITDDPSEALADTDVAIDFSVPLGTLSLLPTCIQQQIGMVIGTTGLEPKQKKLLQKASNQIPILHAPNMSVGVNVAFNLVDIATRALGDDVDIEIFETHHRNKVDAPSGTALRLGEVAANARSHHLEDIAQHGRFGGDTARDSGTITFHAARGGDVVGEHTVVYYSHGERVEITHRATNRANFAQGALRAAEFIALQRSEGNTGMFSMNEVLGLG